MPPERAADRRGCLLRRHPAAQLQISRLDVPSPDLAEVRRQCTPRRIEEPCVHRVGIRPTSRSTAAWCAGTMRIARVELPRPTRSPPGCNLVIRSATMSAGPSTAWPEGSAAAGPPAPTSRAARATSANDPSSSRQWRRRPPAGAGALRQGWPTRAAGTRPVDDTRDRQLLVHRENIGPGCGAANAQRYHSVSHRSALSTPHPS
jgi:hypothetical protein